MRRRPLNRSLRRRVKFLERCVAELSETMIRLLETSTEPEAQIMWLTEAEYERRCRIVN